MVSTHSWKAPSSPPSVFGSTPANSSMAGQASSMPSTSASNSAGVGFGSPSFVGGGMSGMMGGGIGGGIGGSSSTFGLGGLGGGNVGGPTTSTFIAGGGGNPPHPSSATKSILRNSGGGIGGGGAASSMGMSAAGQVADFESLLASSSSLLSSLGRGYGSASVGSAGNGLGGMGGAGVGRNGPGGISGVGDNAQSTGNNPSLFPLGNKSLLELSLASRPTASNFGAQGGSGPGLGGVSSGVGGVGVGVSSATTTYEAEALAHRLLARQGSGFDSAKLGRLARDLEMKSSGGTSSGKVLNGDSISTGGRNAGMENSMGGKQQSLYPSQEELNQYQLSAMGDLSGTSLQEILSRHSEYVVHSALRTSRSWTTNQAKERAESRLKMDWERESNEILGRGILGNRFLMGGGSGGMGGEEEGGALGYGGIASRVPLLEGEVIGRTGVASTSTSVNIVPSLQVMPQALDPLISTHLGAISTHLKNYPHGGTGRSAESVSHAMSLIASLQEGLESPLIQQSCLCGNSNEIMTSYASSFSLLKSIINCSVSLGLDISRNTSSENNSNVILGVMGACNFFSHQFRNHVVEMVREAEFAGHGVGGNASGTGALTHIARDVSAFAAIMAGRDVVDGVGGVWPRLFYCLRCGDAAAAKSIIRQFGNVSGNNEDMSLMDPAVSDIISQLAELQQQQETIFGDSTSRNVRPQPQQNSMLSPTQAMIQSRRVISDLYQRTKTRMSSMSESESFVVYRAACLAMLSGSESISEASCLESSGLVRTVEDYLYASLWHALHLTDPSTSRNKMEAAVARLGLLVNEWGPSYFEQDDANGVYSTATNAVESQVGGTGRNEIPRSGGWAYTLPLLASQQYATALAYLAEAGGGLGLLQATHVALVMDVMGLAINDFSLDGRVATNSSQTLFPMLVASYSASLQRSDAEAALQYIMVLPREGSLIKEQVQRILLETRNFEVLAGKIEADGSRTKAALDDHFTQTEISSLLADAASNAMRAGKAADAAELLVLAGKYSSLFKLMNRELASYLVVSTQDDFDKRQFWFQAACQFHQIHLSPGKTYVIDALNADGCMSLGNTFQLLMNLIVFFDRCREEQWEGAWDVIDTLQLLPKDDSEMTVKVEAFRSLDTCVRQAFHHVVLATMESLCHLYRKLKLGGAGISIDQQNAIDQNLNSLRTRARLLVTFSRLINLPTSGDADTFVLLSQLEKNMM